MFRSLRFRLPAIFLAGIALSGLVASLIAVRLFQDYTRDRVLDELQREAAGLARLYAGKAGDLPLSARSLEEATGDRLFYVGLDPQAGVDHDLPELPLEAIPSAQLDRGGVISFEFSLPDENERLLGVAHPIELVSDAAGPGDPETHTLSALVVAKPMAELRTRAMTLVRRLAIAFVGGIIVAGLLAWYLSRRITKPLLELARAADEVAEGRYDVALPDVPKGDEIGQLAHSFQEMATRLHETEELERNFLMSVSHELRTPLTAIRGHVEALREGVIEDPELRADSLDVIAKEGERLERLVGDILDLAKLEAHRFAVLEEEVDMERLLDQAYAAFGEEARRRAIDYRQDVRARPQIVSDGDRVLQVISNLLSNAFRWTPDGGRIDLELSAENGAVAVAVADSGPGIPAGEAERIFRPFFSRDGGGTGLGLAIAHELAVALGGRIELHSEPGRGSRFELILPARPAS
jgi:signal transduction histidine kinase